MAPPPPADEGIVGETVHDPVQTQQQADFAALIAAAAPAGATGTPDRTAAGATGASAFRDNDTPPERASVIGVGEASAKTIAEGSLTMDGHVFELPEGSTPGLIVGVINILGDVEVFPATGARVMREFLRLADEARLPPALLRTDENILKDLSGYVKATAEAIVDHYPGLLENLIEICGDETLNETEATAARLSALCMAVGPLAWGVPGTAADWKAALHRCREWALKRTLLATAAASRRSRDGARAAEQAMAASDTRGWAAGTADRYQTPARTRENHEGQGGTSVPHDRVTAQHVAALTAKVISADGSIAPFLAANLSVMHKVFMGGGIKTMIAKKVVRELQRLVLDPIMGRDAGDPKALLLMLIGEAGATNEETLKMIAQITGASDFDSAAAENFARVMLRASIVLEFFPAGLFAAVREEFQFFTCQRGFESTELGPMFDAGSRNVIPASVRSIAELIMTAVMSGEFPSEMREKTGVNTLNERSLTKFMESTVPEIRFDLKRKRAMQAETLQRAEDAAALEVRLEHMVQDLFDKQAKSAAAGTGSGGGGGNSNGNGSTTGGNKRKQNQISAKACYHHIHKGGCTIVNCPFDHSLPSGIVKCPKIATCKRGLSCIYSH